MPPAQQRVKVLAEIMRLRRACCNPSWYYRHKALVFSQFIGHLALIREHLDAHGIGYQYLDGSTPVKRRTAAIDAFQAGEGELF